MNPCDIFCLPLHVDLCLVCWIVNRRIQAVIALFLEVARKKNRTPCYIHISVKQRILLKV